MNSITGSTNSLIISKGRNLLLVLNINQFFWPKVFDAIVYFLNRIQSTSLD